MQLVWIDFTKRGKVTIDELDQLVGLAKAISDKGSSKTAILVLAPTLASDRVKNGLIGERCRMEDKLLSKGLFPEAITIAAHKEGMRAHNRRRAAFAGWFCLPTATMPDEGRSITSAFKADPENTNIWLNSDLYIDKTNKNRPRLLPEEEWVVPELCVKNAAPRSNEGRRHFTQQQENAQATEGVEFNTEVLCSALQGVGSEKDVLIFYNLTMFSGSVEKACFSLMLDKKESFPQIATFSVTNNHETLSFAKRAFMDHCTSVPFYHTSRHYCFIDLT